MRTLFGIADMKDKIIQQTLPSEANNYRIYKKILLWAHHFNRCDLDEYRLCEGHVGRFSHINTLPGQGLDDVPVAEVVEVGITIDVGQRRAVEVSVGQPVHNPGFEMFWSLGGLNISNKITVCDKEKYTEGNLHRELNNVLKNTRQ